MNWPAAIERHRAALAAIVAGIVALVGGREGEGVIARGLRSAVLALLRPAESATRRLILIAARDVSVSLPAKRPLPAVDRALAGAPSDRPAAFRLFDPARRLPRLGRAVRRLNPRIRMFFGEMPPPPPAPPPKAPPLPDGTADAARLRRRITALEDALADLTRQARRMARWRARRAATTRDRLASPLRFGRPPGWRKTPLHAIDEVLKDCHALALEALAPPVIRADTS